MTLLVGYAQKLITPTIHSSRPVYLAGFGQNRAAVDVHDELYARALSLCDGSSTIVLCSLDLIGFLRADMQSVLRLLEISEVFRAARPQVVIASTHTHHGPDTLGLWGPDTAHSGVDPAYMAVLKDQTAAAILGSLVHTQPVQVKAAQVHVTGAAKNARNPEIVDDALLAVQFTAEDGRAPVATLVDFPCHPEVLWEHNPSITADYPGVLRMAVEQSSGAPCIFFAGALGGMMTPDVRDHSFEEAEQMGQALAQAALSALQAAEPCPAGPLSLQKKSISPKLTNILYKLAFRRKLLPDVRNAVGRVESEVNLIRLGDIWLATVPGELLPKIGLQLKANLIAAGARFAGIIGLANDELGYILPVEDFHYPFNPFRPGKHYEETNSIGKEIAPQVIEALRSLL